MKLKDKFKVGFGWGFVLVALVLAFRIAPSVHALQLYNQQDNYTYFAGNTGTSTAAIVQEYPGTLHTLVIATPVAGDAITLYDTATGVITAPTTATATITILPSTSTSTATGTYTAVINGVTVTSTSTLNGASTTLVATNLTSAINATTNVSATSSANVITLTALYPGFIGNIVIGVSSTQNGLSFYPFVTNSTGTPIIAQFTLPATTTYLSFPVTETFDAVYKYGLGIQQTASSSLTVSWQQQ